MPNQVKYSYRNQGIAQVELVGLSKQALEVMAISSLWIKALGESTAMLDSSDLAVLETRKVFRDVISSQLSG